MLLLVGLVGCGSSSNDATSSETTVEQALDQLVLLDCVDTPWRSALDELSTQTGLPIKIDPEVDNELSGSISLTVKRIQLRSALGLLLEPLGLAYIPRGDHLEIAMPQKADATLIGKIYPVADLTTDPEFTERELADLIMAVIRPDTWHARRNRSGECFTKPGVLVISQSHPAHEAIARFLEDLRQHRDPQRPRRWQTPAEAAIARALSSRVTLRVDRPWREAIAQTAGRHAINIVIDEPRIQEALGPSEKSSRKDALPPGRAPVLNDVVLGLALDLWLERLGCTWVIRHESLVVTTIDQAAQWLTLRLHPSSLGAAGHHPDNFDFRSLMDSVGSLTWRGPFPLSPGPRFVMAPTSGSMVILGNRWRQNEIATLLPKLRQAIDPLVVDYDERATSPASAKLWRALDEPTTFDYSLQPFTLCEVLDALARQHGGLNIFFQTRALEDAGVHTELDRWRPSLRTKGIRLASAVSLLLEPLGLSWYVQDNVLIVTSKDDADQHLETRVYRAAYLREDRELDEDTFSELILRHVAPDSWPDGTGPLPLPVFCDPGVAAIPQTCDVHDELRGFLHKLAAHLHPEAGRHDWLADTPAERRLYAALERPVTYRAVERPLDEVFTELAAQAGLENLIYNWRALEDAGIDRDNLRSTRVTQDFKDVPLHEALTAVGKPYGIGWDIDHEVLTITSRDDAEQYLVPGFYRFPYGLLDPPGSSAPGPPADRYYYHQVLVEQIQTHVDPKAWQEDGGAGSISGLRSGIILSNTPAIHFRVRRFLNHLRYALDGEFEVPTADRPLKADELAGICTTLGELARGPTRRVREVLDGAMAHADQKLRDAAKKALDEINRKSQRKKTP